MNERGPCDGVLQILRYNRHYYLASVVALFVIGTVLWLRSLPGVIEEMLILGAGLVAFWGIGSLAASYYVYDYAGVTRWDWVPGKLSFPPRHWVNIHAGLDDSTNILAELLPGTSSIVLDVYDPEEMTEASIARARREMQAGHGAIPTRFDALPLPDRSRDTLFLLLSAHEIRTPDRRVAFFKEAARVLTGSGQVLLVEHLRDVKNFLVFGPGFFHFHSKHEWMRVARKAGLVATREGSATPFIRWFLLSKIRQ